jgi:hypothetical protein
MSAAADLSKYAIFDGPRDPKDGTKVSTGTLFRGFTPGDLQGPYLSQFFLFDVPYGSQLTPAKLSFGIAEKKNYMTDPASWLAVQRGCKQDPVPLPIPARRIYRGRDLAQYVHIDELFQAYFNACLLLITPLNRGGFYAPSNLASRTRSSIGRP